MVQACPVGQPHCGLVGLQGDWEHALPLLLVLLLLLLPELVLVLPELEALPELDEALVPPVPPVALELDEPVVPALPSPPP